ncbi:hypothetical protein PF011_g27359 [Phytophthora fragariae]|uniref:Uncharacterized protein n=1 Tax=Phytophthora fragariae TaxID=53985 RepID=A0A6A3HDF6_9STRA|nr:hypothetical protein PF011_g27359 [Phytophthora fragariae]
MSSADDTDAVTAFRPLMTDAHTEQQPRRTSTTGATTNHQMHGSPAAASPHFQIQEPHWALTVRAVPSSRGHHEHSVRPGGLQQLDFSSLEYGGLAHTQVQPLQVLSDLAVSIGGELDTWAAPVDNLRDRTHRNAWTDFHGALESLPVGVTNFDDRFQGPNGDYDEAMGSTFTAGGNVSNVSGADYDSRGNLRNGFVALLLSGNSCDGDGVCGDDDVVRGNGDGVRGDGDGVRGDGDGVRGDDRDVHRDTAGDVEHRWRELSDDAQNLGNDEHEVLVGQGGGEQGDDEYDEAEQDDEGHADDPSTLDGRLSLELEQQIIEAAEKMLRQTPRNSIDTWVLYRGYSVIDNYVCFRVL